ncbi:MAG: cation diffusion facilitator family transporter [Ignavibacteriales bacterium]
MQDSHNHSHDINSYNKAFGYGIALNVIYILIEVVYGLTINSMALIADAGHNLSDVLGLIMALGASYLAGTTPTQTRTYGLRKSTILSALLNAIILLIAIGAITVESIRKFSSPEPVRGSVMMIVAGIGVIINALTALLFIKGKERDINIKGAFLHMAADAGVSLGVVIAGLLISVAGWLWIDPVISLVIVVVVTLSTWSLLKDSFHLSMDAVPRHIELEKVRDYLLSLPGITDVHDLHIWAMSTTETAITAHLVRQETGSNNEILSGTCKALHDKFGIEHSTIQLEDNNAISICRDNKV